MKRVTGEKNVYQILEPMHVYIITLSSVQDFNIFYANISYNRQFFFSLSAFV